MVIQGPHKVIQACLKGISFLARMVATSFFLSVFIHFAVFANLNRTPEALGPQTQHDHTNTYYQPVHNPSSSGTDLPNTQFLKESEGEGKHTLIDNSLPAAFYFQQDCALGIFEKLQPHFTRSLQNRPTLSLFVLHHSWKSFLI